MTGMAIERDFRKLAPATQAVRALIVRESGVWLSLSVVGDYLRGWGFTAQRPIRRATERQDGAVRAWLESTYPAIARKAKAQGCEIQWADETGLSSRANYGRSFAPKGGPRSSGDRPSASRSQ